LAAVYLFWEVAFHNELLGLINEVTVTTDIDAWGWTPEKGAIFIVNATYRFLTKLLFTGITVSQSEVVAFQLIWMSKGPTNVTKFVWQFLFNKIPTRYNLEQRGMTLPVQSRGCVL
jgi:hypothetical protein